MATKGYLKYMAAGIFLLLLFLGYHFELYMLFTPQKIQELIAPFGILAPLAYAVLYFLAILFFLPASVLTVFSGVIFGKLLGSVVVIIAATLAAQTAFFLMRLSTGDMRERLEKIRGVQKFSEKINHEVRKNGFRTFFLMRCFFLPYIPLSYAAGLVKTAQPKDFFLATLLTNMIFTPAFVFFGAALTQGWRALILPVFLVIFVLLVPKIVRKIRKKKAL